MMTWWKSPLSEEGGGKIMTYRMLLAETAKQKETLVRKYHTDSFFRMIVDSDRNKAAGFLALPFLKAIADHVDELMENVEPYTQMEIFDLFSAYYDNNIDYENLPEEARLFI